MTALVSFDRVFELLDLAPMIAERRGRRDPAARPGDDRVRPRRLHLPTRRRGVPRLARVGGRAGDLGAHARCCTTSPSSPNRVNSWPWSGRPAPARRPSASSSPRLYDVTGGAVRDQRARRPRGHPGLAAGRVGMVTQDAHLFHETIRANLLYARPTPPRASWRGAGRRPDPAPWSIAARRAGHRGRATAATGCPGARSSAWPSPGCCSRRPTIVVLDEATAHLDSESEAAVQLALDTALQGRTSLVIAHRLSTVREADMILVLDHGRIVERGRHDDLLAAGGLYAELYRDPVPRQQSSPPDAPATPPGSRGMADSVRTRPQWSRLVTSERPAHSGCGPAAPADIHVDVRRGPPDPLSLASPADRGFRSKPNVRAWSKMTATAPGRTRGRVNRPRPHPGPVVAVSTAAVGYALAIGAPVGSDSGRPRGVLGPARDWMAERLDRCGTRPARRATGQADPNGEVTKKSRRNCRGARRGLLCSGLACRTGEPLA